MIRIATRTIVLGLLLVFFHTPLHAVMLSDASSWWDYSYTAVDATPGSYTINFDFRSEMSADVPNFTWPDAFFATVYYVDGLSQFDLESSSYDDWDELFSLEYLGPYDNYGSITASALGGDWYHFTATLDNEYNFIIPTFELYDGNFITGDSWVEIENVNVVLDSSPAPVPEPGTMLLMLTGLTGLGAAMKRKKHLSSYK
ncbi:hypothetical protein DSCOOX_07270 [Desulfosarcina ovata subsp. ovata]|uniref:Ice-binding protein C-terminal domain-containing protein n=2 Tax=Desulfosarcina ovata TaxID=83564 RepID=A0A5K8A502_9BACT|nr:hypothetical protein DSCOOX_07270 [Desulfosarcina ovata subsp. ovata]